MLNTIDGEAYLEPSYFFIGHFSKYVIEGSVRIGAEVSNSIAIDVIAFLRPDNLVVVIFYNEFNT